MSAALQRTMHPRYYLPTQIANTLVSFIGFLLSLFGLAALIVHAAQYGDGWHTTSFVIYGTCLGISYAGFTLYHIYKFHARWGRLFRIIDHATIYVLIAGTATPFALVSLRGNWGWTLFGAVWGCAVLGILFKIFFVDRLKSLAPFSYVAMGWLLVLAVKPAIQLIPAGGLYLILAGGLCYTMGLIFFLWKRLLFHHAIWHLFVLAGSACHFFAVYRYILPHPLS